MAPAPLSGGCARQGCNRLSNTGQSQLCFINAGLHNPLPSAGYRQTFFPICPLFASFRC
jgi:hypothetical protein